MRTFNQRDESDRAFSNRRKDTQNRLDSPEHLGGLAPRPTAQNQLHDQSGLWQSRYADQEYQTERQAYEEVTAASGFIFTLLIAALTGLGLGVYFYLTTQNQPPTLAPNSTSSVPASLLDR